MTSESLRSSGKRTEGGGVEFNWVVESYVAAQTALGPWR